MHIFYDTYRNSDLLVRVLWDTCNLKFRRIMIIFHNFKNWLSWRLIGPHVCTLAVTVSLNNTWRAPREAFRYGGLPSALLTTLASAGVALPVVLLQLAIGQLSQQDVVGMWSAVPFFKGVGYLRLLISSIAAMYSMVYVSMSVTYIFFTISSTLPFWNCPELTELPDGDGEITYNVLSCLNDTFLAPFNEQHEYYIAIACIVIVLWVLFPFVLYNPVKFMKRVLYIFAPLVILFGLIIVSNIGNRQDLSAFYNTSDWVNCIQPNIWYGALVQALLASQTAGGYLISAGDSIYANTNIIWTTLQFVVLNIIANWFGILFWFAISGDGDKVTSNLAVLVQIYKVAAEKNLSLVWSLLTFAMLSLSGLISMLTFLHPLYDRLRRVGGVKWRHVSAGSSVLGAAGVLTILVIGHPALTLLEDIVVPILLSVATALEVSVFVFIYGWKNLFEDIEFLIEKKLIKYWRFGWLAVPGVIVPFTTWWVFLIFVDDFDWTEAPWQSSGIVAASCTSFIIIITFAAVSVAKQVQYDLIGKLKSSFKPSRHWGPRDPITHHYWLARREEADRAVSRIRYHKRQLGQFSGGSSFANVSREVKEESLSEVKRRSNSDDWLIIYRKEHIAEIFLDYCENIKRSKSLDWTLPRARISQKDDKNLQEVKKETPSDSELSV